MSVRCAACGRATNDPHPWVCVCGLSNAWIDDATDEEPAERALPAGDWSDGEASGIPGTPWAPLFRGGLLPCPSTILLYGGAGSGKTRAALRLSEAARPSLIVSLEMTGSETVAVARELGVSLEGLWVTEGRAWKQEAERVGASLVVVDSLGAYVRPVAELRDAAAWARASGAVVVAIGHANRRGRAKGDSGLSHWPTVVVEARARSRGVELSTPYKNRHGATGPNRPRILVSVAPHNQTGPSRRGDTKPGPGHR